jgi:hypothetical protein
VEYFFSDKNKTCIFVEKLHVMKRFIVIITAIALVSSCGLTGSREKGDKIGTEISPGKAGDYKLGDNIDDLTLLNSQTMNSVDVHVGEGMYETRWFIKDNNIDLVKLSTDGSKKITEIEVLSPLYKTTEGMGTGSSLSQLNEVYADLVLWYTYVSDRFVAETGSLKNVQFIIDPETFTGDRDLLYASDMVELSADQFSADAKVKTIRVF